MFVPATVLVTAFAVVAVVAAAAVAPNMNDSDTWKLNHLLLANNFIYYVWKSPNNYKLITGTVTNLK